MALQNHPFLLFLVFLQVFYCTFLNIGALAGGNADKYCLGGVFVTKAAWSKLFGGNLTITGGDTNISISVGECVGGEGAGRRGCWEQRQTSSIPELCAHIFVFLSSRVSSADATAWRKGLLLFILSLPFVPSLWPFAEGVCVCSRDARVVWRIRDLSVLRPTLRSTKVCKLWDWSLQLFEWHTFLQV